MTGDSMDPRIPLWLDCDPGHDDAMAIILAGHSPKLHLLGISTVAGNQTLAKVTRNALDILYMAGLDHIDVVAGQSKPIMRPSPILCPEIHGESGLDVGGESGQRVPRSPCDALPGKAVIVMFDRISTHFHREGGHRRVRLVCTGALSNAALLVVMYPEVVDMVEVVIMGGTQGVGNTGPVVEFNIQTDPEAAKIVFESGVPLTMVPLEVTHTVLVTPAVLSAIGIPPAAVPPAAVPPAAVPPADAAVSPYEVVTNGSVPHKWSPFRALIRELLMFFATTYRQVFLFEDPPLHDPCAVAYCIAPELYKVQHMRVDIETASPLSAGQTVCDIWRQTGRPANCHVALRVDVEGFWELMLAAIDEADAVSPMTR